MGIIRTAPGICRAISPSLRHTAPRRHLRLPLLFLALCSPWLAQAQAPGNDLGSLCAKAPSCQSRQAGISAGEVGAQVLVQFSRPAESPVAPLLHASDGLFYGTTVTGGDFDLGAIYRVSAAGAYTLLHSFNQDSGAFPRSGLVQDAAGNLYGTAEAGGFGGFGTVYRLAPDGDVTVLHNFEYDDGHTPFASLVLAADGRLYGTTRGGGTSDLGTVFSLATNGEQFTSLHSFDGSEGAQPEARLLQAADGNFYGTTTTGGASDMGTVFRLTPAGAFTLLHEFSGADGEFPSGGLISGDDGALYGLTYDGGPNSEEFVGGAIYRITTAGELSVLYGFPAKASDGTYPLGELLLADDGDFYGVTEHGGADFSGTVFRVEQDGSALTTVLHMTSGRNANPSAGLIQVDGGALFGTTAAGGLLNVGSVFSLTTGGSVGVLHEFGAESGNQPTGLNAGGGALFGSTTQGGGNLRGTLFSLGASGPLQILHDFGEVGVEPSSPPVLGSDGLLYGTTTTGGEQDFLGIVYRRESDGTLTVLHEFSGTDGSFPIGGLHEAADGSFYGTTAFGGANDRGTIFRINDGSFSLLHSFDGTAGRSPFAPPVQAGDGHFYGTTESGGSEDAGVIYRLTAAGQFSVLHHFVLDTGYYPFAGLVEGSDGLLYGTTSIGGGQGEGALFRISRGGDYELLYSFVGPQDGSNPAAPLLPNANGGFYGSTQTGGEFGLGTVFELQADGMLATLHEFGGADGAFPQGPLALLGEQLFVSTAHFGQDGGGTVLRLSRSSTEPEPPASGGGGGGGSAMNPWLLAVLAALAALRHRSVFRKRPL